MSDWRATYDYRLWRWSVLARDRRCVICNATGKLHAHHVNHATYFPELRFEVDNGVTLCGACHMNYHCNFHRSYRTKCDEYNFMNFLHLTVHLNTTWAYKPDLQSEAQDLVRFALLQEDALFTSPDSVVGYVAELATLRYPELV